MKTGQSNNPQPSPLVWVVDSAYTGELHARIGVAERLGFGYEIIPAPNGDGCAYTQILERKYARQCNGWQPPVVIISGTGEETTAQIADLRNVFHERLLNVYLASILPEIPHPRLGEYDLIASPQLEGNNIITLTGVPHPLTHARLAEASKQYAAFFNTLTKPVIGLLVGGNTRYCNGFDENHAQRLAVRIADIGKAQAACIVATNSRRTPESALNTLLAGLAKVPYYFFDWRESGKDFYYALLAHADLFIVTGDSLSMCSEAAFTGKPLLVDLCKKATECYHREIVGRLIDYGAAKLLTDQFEPWSYSPPDPAEAVASAILRRIHGN